MNKKEYQEHHGFTDDEMDMLQYLINKGCKIALVENKKDITRIRRITIEIPTGIIKGIGWIKNKK